MKCLFSRVSTCCADRLRKGAAAVELAICLPMMVILTLGTLEATDLVFLRQRLVSAAFEAARTTTAPGATSAAGIAAGTTVLTQRGITGGSVTVSPTVTSKTATGTEVTATVVAPFPVNCYMSPFILGLTVDSVTATVTMIRQ